VQYPDDLYSLIPRPIKDDVGASEYRSKPRPHLIARSPAEWMFFDQATGIVDFTNDPVCPLPAGNLRIVVLSFREVGAGLR
jgi:hypothetical protein